MTAIPALPRHPVIARRRSRRGNPGIWRFAQRVLSKTPVPECRCEEVQSWEDFSKKLASAPSLQLPDNLQITTNNDFLVKLQFHFSPPCLSHQLTIFGSHCYHTQQFLSQIVSIAHTAKQTIYTIIHCIATPRRVSRHDRPAYGRRLQ